jgi:hypothetical protein
LDGIQEKIRQDLTQFRRPCEQAWQRSKRQVHFYPTSMPSGMVLPQRLGRINDFLHESIQIDPGGLGGGTTPCQSLEAPHEGCAVGGGLFDQG